jgi:hypothetical protein
LLKTLKISAKMAEIAPQKRPFRIAMLRVCHYNAHAIHRPAWKHDYHTRHPPPVSPMDVAFLVPEA